VSAVATRIEAGVGHILLNRPQVMNAISVDLAEQLEAALLELGSHDRVHVIAVRGAGGNFCAGGDYRDVQRLTAEGPEALSRLFTSFRAALGAIDRIDVPVVAVVEGNAMAGGFELLQAADVVLARTDARLCDNHVNHAQVPGGGGSQRLPRILGRQAALAHLLSGERLTGADAQELGLVQRAWPAEEFEERVTGFLSRLAARDRTAVGRIKRLVVDGLAGPLEAGLDLELTTVVDHITGAAPADYAHAFTAKEDLS
jgi:enoyl-CoA hydratase/carnithine racemase